MLLQVQICFLAEAYCDISLTRNAAAASDLFADWSIMMFHTLSQQRRVVHFQCGELIMQSRWCASGYLANLASTLVAMTNAFTTIMIINIIVVIVVIVVEIYCYQVLCNFWTGSVQWWRSSRGSTWWAWASAWCCCSWLRATARASSVAALPTWSCMQYSKTPEKKVAMHFERKQQGMLFCKKMLLLCPKLPNFHEQQQGFCALQQCAQLANMLWQPGNSCCCKVLHIQFVRNCLICMSSNQFDSWTN